MRLLCTQISIDCDIYSFLFKFLKGNFATEPEPVCSGVMHCWSYPAVVPWSGYNNSLILHTDPLNENISVRHYDYRLWYALHGCVKIMVCHNYTFYECRKRNMVVIHLKNLFPKGV